VSGADEVQLIPLSLEVVKKWHNPVKRGSLKKDDLEAKRGCLKTGKCCKVQRS